MRNSKMWSVAVAIGSRYNTTDNLTKKEAKSMFETLAKETTKSAHNDIIDLLILIRDGAPEMTMERLGALSYGYTTKNNWTDDGEYATQLLKAI